MEPQLPSNPTDKSLSRLEIIAWVLLIFPIFIKFILDISFGRIIEMFDSVSTGTHILQIGLWLQFIGLVLACILFWRLKKKALIKSLSIDIGFWLTFVYLCILIIRFIVMLGIYATVLL